MTRYKGSHSAKAAEQDFPHFVDIIVSSGGLGTKLDAMFDFHIRHQIQPRREHGRYDANGSVIRWCFAEPSIAAAFTTEFAGHFS